nr:hypothetical protein [Candidatus Freyarchaeota archaeon]
MVRKLFWSGILIFIPSWAFANGLLFLPTTSDIDNMILVLSFVELAGITLLIGGLLFEFEFQTYWKKIIMIGVAILLVGYWVIPLIINFLYPQVIPVDFVRQIFMPSLWVRLSPAATEITGTLIILLGVNSSPQKNEMEK